MRRISLLLVFLLFAVDILAADEIENYDPQKIILHLENLTAENAVAFCGQQEQETNRDTCLDTVAKNENNYKICALINNTRKKDSCFVYFITNEEPNFDVCDLISSDSLKRSCLSMSHSEVTTSSVSSTTYEQLSKNGKYAIYAVLIVLLLIVVFDKFEK